MSSCNLRLIADWTVRIFREVGKLIVLASSGRTFYLLLFLVFDFVSLSRWGFPRPRTRCLFEESFDFAKMDENAEYLMNAHSRKQITRTKLQRLRQTWFVRRGVSVSKETSETYYCSRSIVMVRQTKTFHNLCPTDSRNSLLCRKGRDAYWTIVQWSLE